MTIFLIETRLDYKHHFEVYLVCWPYWTTLLNNLIVKPYCTTLLYNLIAQPYCTTLFYNPIFKNEISWEYFEAFARTIFKIFERISLSCLPHVLCFLDSMYQSKLWNNLLQNATKPMLYLASMEASELSHEVVLILSLFEVVEVKDGWSITFWDMQQRNWFVYLIKVKISFDKE